MNITRRAGRDKDRDSPSQLEMESAWRHEAEMRPATGRVLGTEIVEQLDCGRPWLAAKQRCRELHRHGQPANLEQHPAAFGAKGITGINQADIRLPRPDGSDNRPRVFDP